MRRFPLIFVFMFLAAFAPAQTTPSAPATNPTMPTDGTVVTPSSPTGPTTPIINLGTTSPSPVGATSATPGNQAGATNSTLQQTAPSGVAPQSTYTTPMVENMPNWTGVAPAASANNQTTTPRDLVIGSSDSAWSISGGGVSVAAAARQYRAERAGRKPRMFTNADIARLLHQRLPPLRNSRCRHRSKLFLPASPKVLSTPSHRRKCNRNRANVGKKRKGRSFGFCLFLLTLAVRG
jgi:hypothetical protein